jgi:hypothetical protein
MTSAAGYADRDGLRRSMHLVRAIEKIRHGYSTS